jgi:hypothetical protein
MEHRLRIDAEPDVIEAHLLDENDVGVGGPGFKVLFGVALRVEDLREPFAEVDAAAEMLCAAVGQRSVLRGGSGRHQRLREKERKDEGGRPLWPPAKRAGCSLLGRVMWLIDSYAEILRTSWSDVLRMTTFEL